MIVLLLCNVGGNRICLCSSVSYWVPMSTLLLFSDVTWLFSPGDFGLRLSTWWSCTGGQKQIGGKGRQQVCGTLRDFYIELAAIRFSGSEF